MNTPFFSIIIPVYNREKIIKDTIQSVLNQTFTNYEIIIIDDCSTDRTEDVIKSINSTKISYIKNSVNRERGYSRNRGISLANGNYICFLDSDDFFISNHLQELYEFISKNNNKEQLIFTNSFNLFSDGTRSLRHCPDLNEGDDIFYYILNYTFNPARVCCSNSIFKKHLFDESIPGLEDLDLWLRIAVNFPINQIRKRTILYNLHDESYTSSTINRYSRELKMLNYIFKKAELKGKLKSKWKNKLISMCHFHISQYHMINNNKYLVLKHSLKSFLLCPKGYNGKTNKILLYNVYSSFLKLKS